MRGAHAAAVAVLSAWSAPDAAQEALRRGHLAHLAAHPDALARSGPPTHLTASCLVLDEAGEHALLVLHRKGRFWVQPGGHVEPDDASLAGAALREALEETGVGEGGLRLRLGGAPADLDRHALPAAFGRCAEHLDVAFLATAPRDAGVRASPESEDVAWWPLAVLPESVVPDLPPRLHRAAALLHPPTALPYEGAAPDAPRPALPYESAAPDAPRPALPYESAGGGAGQTGSQPRRATQSS